MAAAPQAKLLCLHGFLQNGKIFSEKSSGLRKMLKKYNVQMDYIDGPVILEKKDLPFVMDDDAKWTELVDNGINKAWFYHDDVSKNLDLTEAIESVVKHIEANGPYDGIVGFSQGAAVSTIIANSPRVATLQKSYFKLSLAISGYSFTEPKTEATPDALDAPDAPGAPDAPDAPRGETQELQITEKFRDAFSVPLDSTDPPYITKSLFVYGSNDNSVPGARTQYLAAMYPDDKKRVFQHEGGHFVPNKKDFLQPLIDEIVSVLDL